MMRWLLKLVLTLVLFGALLVPARYVDLLVTRELFRASMAVGIFPSGATRFWGQILGLNIPLHSDAFHYGVRFLAATVAFAPLLLLTLGLYHRLVFGRHLHPQTRCGQCGQVLKGLSEPRCPGCGVTI